MEKACHPREGGDLIQAGKDVYVCHSRDNQVKKGFLPSGFLSVIIHALIITGLIFTVHFTKHYTVPTKHHKIMMATLYTPPESNHHKPAPFLKEYKVGTIHESPGFESLHLAHKHKAKQKLKDISGKDLNRLVVYLYSKISQHKVYPRESQELDQEGKATVSFVLAPNGTVSDLRLAGSSGYALLDSAAIQTIQKSEPFSKAHFYLHHAMSFDLPVTFSLNG